MIPVNPEKKKRSRFGVFRIREKGVKIRHPASQRMRVAKEPRPNAIIRSPV